MKVNTDGKVFEAALSAVSPSLDARGRKEIRENAASLLMQVIKAFEKSYGSDPYGSDWNRNAKEPTGLVYGRIQSGKTRAMITTSGMAFDNGFKVVIVLTSNNNRLTDQTYKDFQKGLPDTTVLSKLDLKKKRLELQKNHLEHLLQRDGGQGLVVVTSKNYKSLQDIALFLKAVNADALPAVVFDDEGDEASLDTNTYRRSLGEEVKPSRIHSLIHGEESVRNTLLHEVFVSVTGTPQAILLQSKDTNYNVTFRELLEPGFDYIGGETFFPSSSPENAKYTCIVPSDEKFALLDAEQDIPNGLKDAICFFLLAAASAAKKNGSWDEYKLLCHPSVKQDHHDLVYKQIDGFIEDITSHLLGDKPNLDIKARLEAQFENLKVTAKYLNILPDLYVTIREHISNRKIFIINGKTTDEGLVYSPYFNFMIGGNSIGRGLAIRNLLVTYYVREPKIANMDTMYQHARMFGYRRKTLEFTRVFLPYQLYARFRSIYESDEKTREFIATTTDPDAPVTIDIDVGSIRPTRKNVTHALDVSTVLPGSQLYPDRPRYANPEATKVRDKVMKRVTKLFPDYVEKGSGGIDIKIEDAISLLKPIKTDAVNSWSDKMIRNQIRAIAESNGGRVRLFIRKAPGRQGEMHGNRRVLPQGILSGTEFKKSQDMGYPVLWISEVGQDVRELWDGGEFVYPTVVFPKSMKAFVFNKR